MAAYEEDKGRFVEFIMTFAGSSVPTLEDLLQMDSSELVDIAVKLDYFDKKSYSWAQNKQGIDILLEDAQLLCDIGLSEDDLSRRYGELKRNVSQYFKMRISDFLKAMKYLKSTESSGRVERYDYHCDTAMLVMSVMDRSPENSYLDIPAGKLFNKRRTAEVLGIMKDIADKNKKVRAASAECAQRGCEKSHYESGGIFAVPNRGYFHKSDYPYRRNISREELKKEPAREQ